jgi:16S rRNA (cytosine967-C5)-methyltransferase
LISAARLVAFRVLEAVHGGAYASDALRRESLELDPRDAGLAETIVFGVLRYQAQLDFLIGHFSGRPQAKLDSEVRIALRMAMYQLRYLSKIPAHAAVTEAVELVKRAHKRSAAGFVNAVLRKVKRQPIAWDRATGLSMPAWLLDRWDSQYGPDTATQMASAALQPPSPHINPETGRRQDVGAASIVPFLQLGPVMMVLDLCAAPGNKTAQILAAGARVVACDRSAKRLQEVPSEAHRVVLDAAKPLPFPPSFDRILVDAPCSGTGTLGRNPEIKWRMNPSDLSRLPAIQRDILRNAMAVLKPGGRLVYATCSLEQEENEEVVAGFPVQHLEKRLPGVDLGDGFFIAVIS